MSKLIECTTPRVNPKVNYGLWVIMMCQYWFILGKKIFCTILVSDVDDGGGYPSGGRGSVWGISVPPP